MAEYRLYCLDARGRIARRHDFEEMDDEAAVVAAREIDATSACELWCGSRKVTLLPGEEQGRPAA